MFEPPEEERRQQRMAVLQSFAFFSGYILLLRLSKFSTFLSDPNYIPLGVA